MMDPAAPLGYYFSANVVTQTTEDDRVLAEVLVITLHSQDAAVAGQIAVPLAGLPSLIDILQRVLLKAGPLPTGKVN